jgi:protein phosphatase
MCSNSDLVVKVGMASAQGPRPQNDDFCAISYESDFFAVSDGIGGAPHGDVFSRLVCNAAVDAFERWGDVDKAFSYANNVASSTSKYLGENGGATLLLASRRDDVMEFAWAGDTVALRLRDGVLEMATEPGRVPGGGNALSKAVAYGPVDPDRGQVDVRAGDRFALCTDGVWEYVTDNDIVRIMGDGDNAPLIADALCRYAASVGRDNSTCVVLVVEEMKQGEEVLSQAPSRLTETPIISSFEENDVAEG